MKRNFRTGFLSGLIGALALIIVIGGGLATYLYLNDTSKNDVSAAHNEDAPYDDIVEKLSLLQSLIDTLYLEDVDNDAFATGIYRGFISSLGDPYSTYFTKEEYANLIESSSGVYHGIGAVVSQDVKTGIFTIVKPYKDGPAYKAGLLPEDIIYKVEGEEVTGKDLTEVVSKIKGKVGSKVNVSIYREGVTDAIDVTITRQKISVPTIEHAVLDDNIGYIQILEFDEITISQFSDTLDAMDKDGIEGLVIDVRNNPGGLLDSVVKILDRIIHKGLIVYTEDKYDKRVEEKAVDSEHYDKPIVVLINGNSASASEIFAGALQDYDKATVVGTTSFGKGIVQNVIPLTDGTAVKLTISKYFTPEGRDIHGSGIEPDIEIELEDELKQLITIPHDQDNQLQKAIEVLKENIN